MLQELRIYPYLDGSVQVLSQLPISSISPFPILEINAPTGSGKTLGFTSYLLLNTNAKIFTALPTRISVLNGLKRIKEMVGNRSEAQLIGSAQERTINYTDKSRLVIATSGHVYHKIRNLFKDGVSADWKFCDILYVDEIHTGNLENHLILRLWLIAYQQKKKIPRLLLATATPGKLEKDLFGNILTISLTQEMLAPKSLTAVPKIHDFFHTTQYTLHDRRLYQDAAKVAMEVHTHGGYGHGRAHNLHGTAQDAGGYRNTPHGYNPVTAMPTPVDIKNKVAFANIPGNILIFVPGANESKEVKKELELLMKAKEVRNLRIFELSSEARQEDIDAFMDSDEGIRGVIITTNVAESSVNLSDMLFCIDTMTEKRNISNMVGSSKLVLHWISKASSMQRRGRVGRFQDGYYYRMCLESFYRQLEDTRPDEILRASLTTPVMSLLDVGLDPYQVLQEGGLLRISNSIELLKAYGGVEVLNGQLVTTVMGRFAAKLGIGFRMAKFLWDWWKSGQTYMFPAIVLAAIIDSYTRTLYFFTSKTVNLNQTKKEEKQELGEKEISEKVEKEKEYLRQYAIPGFGDLGVYLNLYVTFINNVTKGNLDVSRKTSVEFCKDNFLDHRRFRETWDNMVHLYRTLGEYGREMNLTIGKFNVTNVINTAIPLISSIYQDYRMKLTAKGNYAQVKTGFLYSLQTKDSVFSSSLPKGREEEKAAPTPVPTGVAEKPGELTALSITELATKDGKFNRIITLWIPREAKVVPLVAPYQGPSTVVTTVPYQGPSIPIGIPHQGPSTVGTTVEEQPIWQPSTEIDENINLDDIIDLIDA